MELIQSIESYCEGSYTFTHTHGGVGGGEVEARERFVLFKPQQVFIKLYPRLKLTVDALVFM